MGRQKDEVRNGKERALSDRARSTKRAKYDNTFFLGETNMGETNRKYDNTLFLGETNILCSFCGTSPI